MRDVRVLSFHAGYGCRHAGACCTSNWPIPIEADRYERARAAIASGALRTIDDDRAPFIEPPADGDEDSVVLLATAHGRCVFHDPAGRCAIQSALGHDALPLACRQFPRVSVIDPRGASVTLSHYCPTAAALLNDGNDRDLERPEGSAAIVVNPAAFPPTGEYVGLDARSSLPPLLRPGMLMDWDSWWEIERRGVDTLLSRGGTPEEALGLIRGAVQSLLRWGPEDGPLGAAVERAFRETDPERGSGGSTLVSMALDAVPDDARTLARWDLARANRAFPGDVELRRFLAAHAFANWTIHLGDGLLAWMRSIETALAFVEAGAGVRQTDLVLRHLIDPQAFARGLGFSTPPP
jgi:Fe-S-cluster containining protein